MKLANYTKPELMAELYAICAELNVTKDVAACDAVVFAYSQKIYDALTGKIPPEQVR